MVLFWPIIAKILAAVLAKNAAEGGAKGRDERRKSGRGGTTGSSLMAAASSAKGGGGGGAGTGEATPLTEQDLAPIAAAAQSNMTPVQTAAVTHAATGMPMSRGMPIPPQTEPQFIVNTPGQQAAAAPNMTPAQGSPTTGVPPPGWLSSQPITPMPGRTSIPPTDPAAQQAAQAAQANQTPAAPPPSWSKYTPGIGHVVGTAVLRALGGKLGYIGAEYLDAADQQAWLDARQRDANAALNYYATNNPYAPEQLTPSGAPARSAQVEPSVAYLQQFAQQTRAPGAEVGAPYIAGEEQRIGQPPDLPQGLSYRVPGTGLTITGQAPTAGSIRAKTAETLAVEAAKEEAAQSYALPRRERKALEAGAVTTATDTAHENVARDIYARPGGPLYRDTTTAAAKAGAETAARIAADPQANANARFVEWMAKGQQYGINPGQVANQAINAGFTPSPDTLEQTMRVPFLAEVQAERVRLRQAGMKDAAMIDKFAYEHTADKFGYAATPPSAMSRISPEPLKLTGDAAAAAVAVAGLDPTFTTNPERGVSPRQAQAAFAYLSGRKLDEIAGEIKVRQQNEFMPFKDAATAGVPLFKTPVEGKAIIEGRAPLIDTEGLPFDQKQRDQLTGLDMMSNAADGLEEKIDELYGIIGATPEGTLSRAVRSGRISIYNLANPRAREVADEYDKLRARKLGEMASQIESGILSNQDIARWKDTFPELGGFMPLSARTVYTRIGDFRRENAQKGEGIVRNVGVITTSDLNERAGLARLKEMEARLKAEGKKAPEIKAILDGMAQ